MSLTPERLMGRFAAGWRAPHPHAWDDVVADEVQLRQPLLPDRRGRAAVAEEYGRLLALVPDLTGRVDGWCHRDGVLVVRMELAGHLGRRELRLPVTDTITLDGDGRIARRVSRVPVAAAVLALAAQPRVWPAWWRSGIGPGVARRRLTDRRPAPGDDDAGPVAVGTTGRTSPGDDDAVAPRVGVPDALALGRLLLAAAAWAAPDRSARLLGLDPAGPSQRYLLRVFAGRAAALGLGALASTGAARRRWQRLGLLVDVSDTLAGLDPRLGRRARLTSLAITATYAALGARELSGDRRGAGRACGDP